MLTWNDSSVFIFKMFAGSKEESKRLFYAPISLKEFTVWKNNKNKNHPRNTRLRAHPLRPGGLAGARWVEPRSAAALVRPWAGRRAGGGSARWSTGPGSSAPGQVLAGLCRPGGAPWTRRPRQLPAVQNRPAWAPCKGDHVWPWLLEDSSGHRGCVPAELFIWLIKMFPA